MGSLSPFKVKCLDSKYDNEDSMLVLLCMVPDTGVRIFCFPKSDFTFQGDSHVPDDEMRKTAKLWRGKWFYMEIQDDPNRQSLDSEDQSKYVSLFKQELSNIMGDIKGGLGDEDKILQRYVGDLIQQEKKKGGIDLEKMIHDELKIRNSVNTKDT